MAIKKNEIVPFVTAWMDLEDIMLGLRGCYAKWNKLVRERQIPYDVTYMWNLNNNINEQIKLTDS